jgi:hypothetical protein
VTVADLTTAVTTAVRATAYTTPEHPIRPGCWHLTWGEQLDFRPITLTGRTGELTDTAIAGYLAKYATKSTNVTGHVSGRITTDTIRYFATKATHTGRLIALCWGLGSQPRNLTPDQAQDWKDTYGKLRRWAHMLGFGGHLLTKSRRYTVTRQHLKNVRRQWRRNHRPAIHRTAEHTTEKTTLIVGTLTFAGIGYRTTGDQLLALTAAAEARERRQIAKQESAKRIA